MKHFINNSIMLIATLTFLLIILRLANIIFLPWWIILCPIWLQGTSLMVLMAAIYIHYKISHRNDSPRY